MSEDFYAFQKRLDAQLDPDLQWSKDGGETYEGNNYTGYTTDRLLMQAIRELRLVRGMLERATGANAPATTEAERLY